MSDDKTIGFDDNPDFNRWLVENYYVEIENYEFPASVVLYKMSRDKYFEALTRYNADPKVSLDRIEDGFPTPIAHYFFQANNNYQNDHQRLDLLKSTWEAIIFLLFGLVVGEARHRGIDLKAIGIKWPVLWSDKLFSKITVVENILDHVLKTGIPFSCAEIIPIETLALIKKLNQERNGFEHSAAKTEAQQKILYKDLYPQVEQVLKQLIKLEDVLIFRYHAAETPLYPRCEISRGNSLSGKKDIVPIRKDNFVVIMEYFNAGSIFAKVQDEVFCLSPFVHYAQEEVEANAILCFYKQDKGGKYHFEVVGKSKNIEVDKMIFDRMESYLKKLVS